MEMVPQQEPFLTIEQRELRALANEAATLVQYMTRDRGERGIQCLLPLVGEAVVASHVVVPEDLDEKKGMDLIEAIRQRRKRDHQAATSSLVETGSQPPKSGGDDNPHKGQKKKKKKKEKKPPKEKEEFFQEEAGIRDGSPFPRPSRDRK